MTEKKDVSWTYGYKPGGLLRCCIQSLQEAMGEYVKDHDEPPPDGYVVTCRYHDSKMICHDGMFEWDRQSG